MVGHRPSRQLNKAITHIRRLNLKLEKKILPWEVFLPIFRLPIFDLVCYSVVGGCSAWDLRSFRNTTIPSGGSVTERV